MAVIKFMRQIREAVSHLNPSEVREAAERPLSIGLYASTSASFTAMEDFLAPPGISRDKRWEVVQAMYRAGDPGGPDNFDLEIYEEGLPRPEHGFSFSPYDPYRVVEDVLTYREELGLPLARYFPPFRRPVVQKVINGVSRENAVFALMTAFPDVVPNLLQVPWAVSEFASDTAFLTMNQIRMAFLLAAASDRPIGYREQKTEVAGVIAGAFGWRALARELVGKIPFGGGLIPKAAIAFAGTYVVGSSLERMYRIGYGFTREERRLAYNRAIEKGKAMAGQILGELRKPRGQSANGRPEAQDSEPAAG